MTDTRDLISLAQAAARFNLHAGSLRNAAIAGTLKAEKIGRNWVVSATEIARYASEQRHAGGRPRKAR